MVVVAIVLWHTITARLFAIALRSVSTFIFTCVDDLMACIRREYEVAAVADVITATPTAAHRPIVIV